MFDKETNTFFKSTIELYFHKKKLVVLLVKTKWKKTEMRDFLKEFQDSREPANAQNILTGLILFQNVPL